MASGFICAYSIGALFPAHLQADLHMSPALLATPIALANLFAFLAASSWGWLSDRIGRRWAMIAPGLLAIVVAPFYLFTDNFVMIVIGFTVQGMAGSGGMVQMPDLGSTESDSRWPVGIRYIGIRCKGRESCHIGGDCEKRSG